MYIAQRTLGFMQAFLKSYGPSNIKRLLWDKEYSGSKWNFADNTVGDCVYPHLEKYVKNGSILDLGCGSGNTASELAATAYRTYVGVDISEAALSKAERRTAESGRADKNRFAQGDFLSYVPTQQFDVILFRESLYHIPLSKVKAVLGRCSRYLRDGGVFIVRLKTSDGKGGNRKNRPNAMIGIIETDFDVVEKCVYNKSGTTAYSDSGATVIVFRPRCAGRKD
jgi:SAM-dependent methyltransferase